METQNHTDHVGRQFGSHAENYLTSAVHAQGEDLVKLGECLEPHRNAAVLDVGCGAGHASFAAAPHVRSVTAYDLSEEMLAVVRQAAAERGLTNIRTCRGAAEALPFDDASMDVVFSRYSAHHWHDVGRALREIRRVLKPGGQLIVMDIASPGLPVLDVHLQTIEKLRDPSHVRDYAAGEWLHMLHEAGFLTRRAETGSLNLEFAGWVQRLSTPPHFVAAILALQKTAPAEVVRHFAIAEDGSFRSDTVFIEAVPL